MKRKARLRGKKHGFTVVELLIATSIFAVVLLVAAFAFLQIGRSYSKGTTEVQTQSAARAVLDDVSQAIQFSGGTYVSPASGVIAGRNAQHFCIGENRYIYTFNEQLIDNTDHAFVKDKKGSGCPSPYGAAWPVDINDPIIELLGPRMRLANFEIDDVGGGTRMYEVTVRIVYGDDELLCSTAQGNCNNNNATTFTTNPMPDLNCKTGAGRQFCAVSELSTTVQSRI